MSRSPLVALAALLLLLPATTPRAARAGGVIDYDAGLGVLPETRGWTYADQATGAPAPSLVDGVLHPGATTAAQSRWWRRNDASFRFDTGMVIEVVVNPFHSGFEPNLGGTHRSGFYFDLIDSLGRRVSLGIDSVGIVVNTDLTLSNGNGVSRVAFTPGLHDFQVETRPDSLILTIDGARAGAAALGTPVIPGDPDDVYFGDGSGAAGSDVAIRLVRYGAQPGTAAVPSRPEARPVLRIRPLGPPGREGADLALAGRAGDRARVRVFDPSGRRIADLGTLVLGAAETPVHWNGADVAGHAAGAGVYLVAADDGVTRAVCRVVRLR